MKQRKGISNAKAARKVRLLVMQDHGRVRGYALVQRLAGQVACQVTG